MVSQAWSTVPRIEVKREYVLSGKYAPAITAWGLLVPGSNCNAYDVAYRPDLKLIVGHDGSFGLYVRRSEGETPQKISSGSPGTIFQVDPVTGRPPGAAVWREVEERNPLRQNGVTKAELFKRLIQNDPRDRRYLRREEDIRSEAAHQWVHIVDTFFPGSPIGRITTPPDSFIDLIREDHVPAPVPPREDPAPEVSPDLPDLGVLFDDFNPDTAPPIPEPEKKEERRPTRFELIEF
jgi:hypothetical protein